MRFFSSKVLLTGLNAVLKWVVVCEFDIFPQLLKARGLVPGASWAVGNITWAYVLKEPSFGHLAVQRCGDWCPLGRELYGDDLSRGCFQGLQKTTYTLPTTNMATDAGYPQEENHLQGTFPQVLCLFEGGSLCLSSFSKPLVGCCFKKEAKGKPPTLRPIFFSPRASKADQRAPHHLEARRSGQIWRMTCDATGDGNRGPPQQWLVDMNPHLNNATKTGSPTHGWFSQLNSW